MVHSNVHTPETTCTDHRIFGKLERSSAEIRRGPLIYRSSRASVASTHRLRAKPNRARDICPQPLDPGPSHGHLSLNTAHAGSGEGYGILDHLKDRHITNSKQSHANANVHVTPLAPYPCSAMGAVQSGLPISACSARSIDHKRPRGCGRQLSYLHSYILHRCGGTDLSDF